MIFLFFLFLSSLSGTRKVWEINVRQIIIIASGILSIWVTLIMTFRVSDWQSESDLLYFNKDEFSIDRDCTEPLLGSAFSNTSLAQHWQPSILKITPKGLFSLEQPSRYLIDGRFFESAPENIHQLLNRHWSMVISVSFTYKLVFVGCQLELAMQFRFIYI